MPDRIKIAAVQMERELMKTGENLPTELVTLRNRVLTQLRNCAIVIKRGLSYAGYLYCQPEGWSR